MSPGIASTGCPITACTIRPEDCVLGFGIPTSAAAFVRARRSPTQGFVAEFSTLNQYRAQVLRVVVKLRPTFAELGCHLVEDMGLDAFAELFGRGYKVIILFSHWQSDAVEFADGLAPVPAILAKIPPEYAGFLDLSICHPEKLTTAVRAERPRCRVCYTDDEATPVLWLYFYYALIHRLRHQSSTYVAALEATIAQFRKKQDVQENPANL